MADSAAIRRRVTLVSAVTALGGLLFGYDTGVISGALIFLHGRGFTLSNLQKELLTSLLLVGALVGAMAAGPVADRIGRRRSILITAAVFIAGVLAAAFSPTYGVLLAMRVVIGLAVGASSMLVPMYIAEVAPPRVRGALVSLNQLAITSGILISYLIDYGLQGSRDWRLCFGLAAIPAGVLFVGMLFEKESPNFLVTRGRLDEARSVLDAIRDPSRGDDVSAEIRQIRKVSERTPKVRDLFAPKARKLVVIGIALAVFQQVTGINTVIYYAPTLLKDAGLGSSASLLANVVNGVVNVAFTIVAIWLLDRVGRRPLLITGTSVMAVALVAVAVAFAGGSSLHGTSAYVAIVGLFVYTAGFAVGLGPVFWLLISEIYPLRLRGRAMSYATMANWGANFIVTISFLTLISAIGGLGVFLLYAALTVSAVVYFVRVVPETKGRTLQEIEADLGTTGLADRDLDAEAA
jgi:sugar porter (SP) family MFS transporter